jgi:hypothetical protein
MKKPHEDVASDDTGHLYIFKVDYLTIALKHDPSTTTTIFCTWDHICILFNKPFI